jgi:hypothetical protein
LGYDPKSEEAYNLLSIRDLYLSNANEAEKELNSLKGKESEYLYSKAVL